MTIHDIYIEERLENKIIQLKFKNNNYKITINRGTSFGGSHTTTSLSIESLKFILKKERLIENSLDLGSGSGILSIIMKKLGIKNVKACEIDNHAKTESISNFKSNFDNKNHHPKFVNNPLEERSMYNLIISNISGSYLPNNFKKISKKIKPDGYLSIAGFNYDKQDFYASIAENENLKLIKTFKDPPWISMVFKKDK